MRHHRPVTASSAKRGRAPESGNDTGAKVAKRIKEYTSASNYSAKQIRDMCKDRFGKDFDASGLKADLAAKLARSDYNLPTDDSASDI